MNYQNHFGKHSEEYLRFRPDYPQALYDFIYSLLDDFYIAWDCGTGNGQAAVHLADKFEHVIATDLQAGQLQAAMQKPNILYCQARAEQSPLQRHSINLVTIAQALHWFDFKSFYPEVTRVLKPKAIIAAWCYGLGKVNTEIDQIVERLYQDILGDQYWLSGRRYIDEGYQTLPFPFKEITAPMFIIEKKMNIEQFLGYLNTWSAVKEYTQRNHKNPIDLIQADLIKAYGGPFADPYTSHIVTWPIYCRMGQV